MDLWRRAAQGRLAEVLGINFVTRDAMTRRVQYRGDLDAEWASYGPDTRAIAIAFVHGINAWVTLARAQPPEEFERAGWLPELWEPEDLLNRTDAFLASSDALSEAFRSKLTSGVSDALRAVGTDPFLTTLSGKASGSNAWVVSGRRSAAGAPLLAVDPHRPLANPSLRYLVHLTAPGWNVIGATSPWLPGVAIGHNDRVAWGMTASAIDTQDLFVEHLNPDNRHQVDDNGRWINTRVVMESLLAKGRPRPVTFLREYTPHGIIIAVDGEKHLAFSLRWSGSEPGAAGELAALGLDRARSVAELREALRGWRMPTAEFVYADRDGDIGSQVAGLVPVRPGWSGWRTLDDLPHAAKPASGYLASANENAARVGRLHAVLGSAARSSVDDFTRLQHDTLAGNAVRLVPLLTRVHADRPDVEQARQELLRWDRRMSPDSVGAAIYAAWERELRRMLAEAHVEFVVAVTQASGRDALLLKALTLATDDLTMRGGPSIDAWQWSHFHLATFAHLLGITTAMRDRFNVGPFAVPGYSDTVMATGGVDLEASTGASFAAVMDIGDWDRSVVQNAPGQSGSPVSAHFKDLATLWAAGKYFPLAFSDAAVQANAESILTLVPKP